MEQLYAPTTVDHFQHPRNVGRMLDADGAATMEDRNTDTTITIFLALAGERIARATFRAFGCSACIAAGSMATEMAIGRTIRQPPPSAEALDRALGGLPVAKRYCAELAARTLSAAIRAAEKAFHGRP